MNLVGKTALAADTFVPQRDLLLDIGEVTRHLSAGLGTSGPVKIDRCERVRVKYRVGDYLRVLHRIQVGNSSYTIAARTVPHGNSKAAYERAVSVAVPSGPLRSVLLDSDLDTIFWTFPNDWKITGLRSLTEVPQDFSPFPGTTWSQSRLVAYAPGKCATVQCLDDQYQILAYAKIYAEDDGRHSYRIYDALWQSLLENDSHLRIPCALAYSETYRALLLEPVEGKRISDLNGKELLNGFRHLGSALAALHKLPVPDHLSQFKRLEVDSLLRAGRIVGQARPDVARRADKLARELQSRWRPANEPFVCLHGDVHPKNGVLRNDCLTLIDLDQAGSGPAAADLGSLLAILHYNRRVGLLSQTVHRALHDTFLAGYTTIRDLPDPASLRWHTAAALLAERALRAVNRIRPEGLQHLDDLLADAEALVVGGNDD